MSLDLWKPLKINNPLLEDIFNQPIDGKILPNGNIQAHPLIIFENKKDKTYYCIRLQTATSSTIRNNVLIDNSSYQKDYYWKFNKGVAVTKDIFIIDKELLENNIDETIYKNTLSLNNQDKSLVLNDLEKRINSIPPNLNILKISNNLKNNLVLYTNNKQITNQFYSTISPNNKFINQEVKDYYSKHFDKNEFLNNTNTSNIKHTQEALKNIKLCIDKENNIINQNDFQYELDKQSSNYFISKQEENINSNNSDLNIEPLDELEQENSLYLDDFKKVKSSNVGDLEVIETSQINQVQIDDNSLQKTNEEENKKQKPLVHQWRKSTQKLK